MTAKASLAFIGLGVMGGPMAGHLARAGYRLTAYNRSPGRAAKWRDAWADEGLEIAFADTPGEAAQAADIVFTCVGNDEDLAEIVLGEAGVLGAMAAGALLVDHTTTSADMARNLAKACQARAIGFVDAPVSGGEAGAVNGKLAIMCGGGAEDLARAEPVMQSYAKAITHVGPAGAGQTAKMANQMCIAGVLAGLSEAVRLAEAAGLDLDKTYQAISGGAAQSWQMDNRWPTMTQGEFDFGFAIDWMRKDLGYALEEARRLGLAAPVTALVDQFYADVQAAGGGRKDTSALITRLPRRVPKEG
ncbi:NAD(P)-dependent oxidoreductase [Erythrobacter sanguineus]|jgi:3-hydroxyisobutyrate dehydrogenase|uniref:3-hydroxyisobutyrate dehydrogenase n=1 Tax=Erythrobacter sanguineus TaxID=198312 RepID=A0A1M7SDG8_9SPHN|nr:NAD(P)-dependent oxidoreductase [Erythrobacter sanguineus]SHN56520.1 3-hydroxyisobutyrate dehydrogenase [Erythrobacter sanguineus]